MKLTRVVLAILFAGAVLAPTAAAQAAPAISMPVLSAPRPAEPASEASVYMQTIWVKVNDLRASLGLDPVTRYVQLDAVSQDWSAQMAASNAMSHRPNFASVYPDGWSSAAENVAMCGECANTDVGAMFFDLWLNSPGHFANMVASDANSIGIGLAFNPSTNSWFGTQNFAAYPDPLGAGLTVSGGEVSAAPVQDPVFTPAPVEPEPVAPAIPEPPVQPEMVTSPVVEQPVAPDPAAIPAPEPAESPVPVESAGTPPATTASATPAEISQGSPEGTAVAATATAAERPMGGLGWVGLTLGIGAVGAGVGSILLVVRRGFP